MPGESNLTPRPDEHHTETSEADMSETDARLIPCTKPDCTRSFH